MKAAERNAVAKALDQEFDTLEDAATAAIEAHRAWWKARPRYAIEMNYHVVGPFSTINEANTWAYKQGVGGAVRAPFLFPEEVEVQNSTQKP